MAEGQAFADRLERQQHETHTWDEVVATTRAAVDSAREREAAFLALVEGAAALSTGAFD